MKKILLTLIITFTVIFSVNAQVSSTYKGSGNTIKTFTDTYMDVQYFNTNPYYKNFGFFDVDGNDTKLSLGYAHDFGKVQFGTFIDTAFAQGSRYFLIGKHTASLMNFYSDLAFLLGFKNHGFKYGMHAYGFMRDDTTGVYTGNDGKDYQLIIQQDDLLFDVFLHWGGCFNTSSFYLRPIVGLTYGTSSSEDYANDIPEENVYKKEWDYVTATLGFDFDLKSSSSFHHIIGINTNTKYETMKYYGAHDIHYSTTKGVYSDIDLNYKMSYIIEDKLQFSLKTTLSNIFVFNHAYDAIDNHKYGILFQYALSPIINLGLLYEVKKDVFNITVGTKMNIPSIQYGKVEYNIKLPNEQGISYGDFYASLSTGLNWFITKYVSLDSSLSIPLSPSMNPSIIDTIKVGVTLKK